MNFRLASINVRCLNKTLKRKHILTIVIILTSLVLQETYIVKQIAEQWKEELGGCLLFSEGTTSSKGQVIFIYKIWDIKSLNITLYETNKF